MYKRIILLGVIAILVIISAVFILKNAFTKSASQTAIPAVSPEILQKFNENYPSKNLFPYRSINLVADYKIEPKSIYITTKTNLSHESALLEIDSYLKKYGESVAILEGKGIKFLFAEPNTDNHQILD